VVTREVMDDDDGDDVIMMVTCEVRVIVVFDLDNEGNLADKPPPPSILRIIIYVVLLVLKKHARPYKLSPPLLNNFLLPCYNEEISCYARSPHLNQLRDVHGHLVNLRGVVLFYIP